MQKSLVVSRQERAFHLFARSAPAARRRYVPGSSIVPIFFMPKDSIPRPRITRLSARIARRQTLALCRPPDPTSTKAPS